MAFSTTRITGRVPLPTGEIPIAAEVVFTLTGWDRQDENVVPPAEVRAVLDTSGNLPADFALWRTAAGDRDVTYAVKVHWTEKARLGFVAKEADLGRISVAGLNPLSLADLLALPAPIPNVPDALAQALGAAAAARGDAVISETKAGEAAGSATAAGTAKTQAETARDLALMYAGGAAYVIASLSELQASGAASYPVGTTFVTRDKTESFVVVGAAEADYDVLTAGGVKLRRVIASDQIGTIVVYGSSTLRGTGSTGAVNPAGSNDWTGGPNAVATLLKNKLGARAKFVNRSIGGRSMQELVDNFDLEVSRYRPRFVITGSGWANEPGETGREKAESYIKWAAQLIAKCRSIGATPIFAAFNPINNHNYMRYDQYDVMRAISEMGVRIWPLFGAAATGLLTFKAGLNADTLHANDAGHLVYLDQMAIHDLYTQVPISPREPPKYEVLCPAAPTEAPVTIRITDTEDRCRSWTVSVVVRNISATATTSALIYFRQNGGQFRIRQEGGTLSLIIGTTVLIQSTINPRADFLPHRHICAYDHVSETITWWMDGVLVGSSAVSGVGSLEAVDFGRTGAGNFDAEGMAIRELTLWRWPFLDDGLTVPAVEAGFRPDWGLVADADFSKPVVSAMPNLANNRVPISTMRDASTLPLVPSNGAGFLRHANGVQECWGQVVLARTTSSRLGGIFTFPKAFVRAADIVTVASPVYTGALGAPKVGPSQTGVRTPTTTQITVEMFSDALYAEGDTVTVNVRATGYWK